MTAADAEEKSESEMKELIALFSKQLDVDEEVALILVQEGFSTIEEVAYVPTAELVAIEEFDEDIVDELRSRARDVLLTQAIVQEEKIDEAEPVLGIRVVRVDLARPPEGRRRRPGRRAPPRRPQRTPAGSAASAPPERKQRLQAARPGASYRRALPDMTTLPTDRPTVSRTVPPVMVMSPSDTSASVSSSPPATVVVPTDRPVAEL